MLIYLLLVVGFALLIKGADFLVDGSSSIARKLNVSDLIIGLTIVAFGTSAPELCVNIISSIKGNADIAIGNILGSNIFNIFLILGVSAIIFPLKVTKGTVWKEIPLTFLAVVLLGILANDRLIDNSNLSQLSRIDGLVLLAFFIIFLVYVIGISMNKEVTEQNSTAGKPSSWLKSLSLISAGFAGLFIGAKFVVDSAVQLALMLGVSQSLIALTVVAAGTSLPELATSAVAAYRKNCNIAVGNIVGSNIFNIFFILGISSLIRPIAFEPKNNVDIGVTTLASLLLFVFMFSGKRRSLDRWEGGVFVVLYIGYIVFLIVRG
jgi:cation:H+ antiporter